MDLPESPEMEFELRQLKKWTCMLNDLQLTTAIVQMVQETSLAQVLFLKDVLKQREIEYTILQDLGSEYFPLPQAWPERKGSRSPSNTNSTGISNVSSNTSFHSPNINADHAPLSRSHTVLSPPSGFPCPILSPTSISNQQAAIRCSREATKISSKPNHDAQIHLVRLTTLASHSAQIHKKRSRKVPYYPRDESDPKWLLKWLHSLRLHKFAPCLKGLTPGALLELAGDQLMEKGISSIGARKKLVVAFEEARKQISEDEKKSV